MRPSYSKRTVDEAVQLLDVYASQRAWCPVICGVYMWVAMSGVMLSLDASRAAQQLAYGASASVPGDALIAAAEAAQRLREGWRP
jgi:hypothetical protein